MPRYSRRFWGLWLGCLLPCFGAILDASSPVAQAQMSGGGPVGGLNMCDNLCRQRMYFDQPGGVAGGLLPCLRYTKPTCNPCSGGNTACVQRAGDSNTSSTCSYLDSSNFLTTFQRCNDLCTGPGLNFVEADTQFEGDMQSIGQDQVFTCP